MKIVLTRIYFLMEVLRNFILNKKDVGHQILLDVILDVKKFCYIISEYRHIWIVGSSIVRKASEHTNRRPTGTNFGLERLGYMVMDIKKWDELVLQESIARTKETRLLVEMHVRQL